MFPSHHGRTHAGQPARAAMISTPSTNFSGPNAADPEAAIRFSPGRRAAQGGARSRPGRVN